MADCVAMNVTVSGKSCQHELRGDVVVCPLPPSLQLGKNGAPLQVGSSVGPPQEARVGGGGLQAGPEPPPNAPQVCVDGGCSTLGKVVRPGLEGVPQSTLLGVLLALLLLVAVLAAILVLGYRRRKQLGEPYTAILTQPSPLNYDVSKPLYPLSAQALGVCPHLRVWVSLWDLGVAGYQQAFVCSSFSEPGRLGLPGPDHWSHASASAPLRL